MGLLVNTNIDAIRVHNNLTRTNNSVTSSLQRLSSGLKIRSAKDDASGFAIANSFKAKIAAMRVASQNASEGQSMLQTADGAYSRINDILVRMKSLATQAASGQTESLATMNNEFFALQNEIDQIANSTQYGGTYLIKGGSSGGSGPDFSAQITQYASGISQLQAIAANSSNPQSSVVGSVLTQMASAAFGRLTVLSPSKAFLAAQFLIPTAGYFAGTPAGDILDNMLAQANALDQTVRNLPLDFSAQATQYASDISQLQSIAGNSSDSQSTAAGKLLNSLTGSTPSLATLDSSKAFVISLGLSSSPDANSFAPGSTARNLVLDMTAQANAIVQVLDNLVAGGTSGVTFQVGATNSSTDRLVISFNGATTNGLGVSSSSIGIASQASAQAAMNAIDSALTSINSYMGSIGAYQNRLQYTIDNLATGIENFASSASTIEDVDMASEINDLTKSQILQQAGMAMLAQANTQPQSILKLLQG